MKRGQGSANSVPYDDAPIESVASVCRDDETGLLLWHVGEVSMYATVRQKQFRDIAKELVRSPMCAIRLA